MKKARRWCFRCKAKECITYTERPLCHGCRRELMGLPRDGSAPKRAYWREHMRRRVAGAREEWSD